MACESKWKELCDYFYGLEISDDYCNIIVPYNTKTLSGFIFGEDCTWTHILPDDFKDLEWIYIVLTEDNKKIVVDGINKIQIPYEIKDDKLYIYINKNGNVLV